MFVSHRHKFILVHIPRTGGKSMTQVFMPHGSEVIPGQPHRHMTCLEFRDLVGRKRWNSYFKFAFVRNPWDRWVSLYRFHTAGLRPGNSYGIWHGNVDMDEKTLLYRQRTWGSFPQYIGRVTDRYNPYAEDDIDWGRHSMTQTEYLLDDSGNCMVDFVGRFENLKNDFGLVLKRIGLSLELPYINASSHSRYVDYYDRETRMLVKKHSSETIERFGYKYNV